VVVVYLEDVELNLAKIPSMFDSTHLLNLFGVHGHAVTHCFLIGQQLQRDNNERIPVRGAAVTGGVLVWLVDTGDGAPNNDAKSSIPLPFRLAGVVGAAVVGGVGVILPPLLSLPLWLWLVLMLIRWDGTGIAVPPDEWLPCRPGWPWLPGGPPTFPDAGRAVTSTDEQISTLINSHEYI
jgi:hypothetical protein